MSEANEGILVPGEVAEVESRARAQGWVSKEEFEANEKNVGKKWRPADEFVERGEMLDTMKSLRHEITKIKTDFNALADHHKKVAETEYKRALETLRAQRTAAAEEGDTAAVVQLSDKIDELKETHREQLVENKPVQGVHPAFPRWIEDNPWYQSDPELRAAADAAAQSYSLQNPGAPFEDVLGYVTKRVKERFMKSESKPKVSSVESATTGGGISTKSKGFSKADLSDEEKEVMTMLVKRKVMTEEEYINDLAKVKGL